MQIKFIYYAFLFIWWAFFFCPCWPCVFHLPSSFSSPFASFYFISIFVIVSHRANSTFFELFSTQIEQWSTGDIGIQWWLVCEPRHKNHQHLTYGHRYQSHYSTRHWCDGRHFSIVNAFSWFLIKACTAYTYTLYSGEHVVRSRMPEYAINDFVGRWKSHEWKKAHFNIHLMYYLPY